LLALHVNLDFACCICGHLVGVTLRCEGTGLASRNPVASVKVPCPTCAGINQIFFSPGGTLHRVEREQVRYRMPEPCTN
jgi:phage FluMu protein Com